MAFNTVGIQDNLPVLPVHVLQIIESLTFSGTYAAESIYRQGRTNFGASAFTSSAHVEMHNYNGTDPLAVYSGLGGGNLVFKVDTAGGTTATAVTASGASVTTASLGRTTIDTAIIATEAVGTSTITSATITSAAVSSAVITTLNGTVGAIATFTASNAQVTNTATIATANVTNLTATNLTATNANLTGSLLGSATSASYALSASYAVSASQAGSALTASFITGSGVAGTVTSASYALTASYALNSTAGGPGGGQGQIQYFSASVFAGVPTLVYNGTTLTATGSFSGSLNGTASFAPIVAGPGITVNGMEVTASVRTVNGIVPTNGNIAVSLAGVITGTSSSLVSSGSGAVTASISNGALWVISGDATPANNGDAYIFKSGSVGQWLPVAPLDTAAGDARYLMLNGGNAATQDLNFGGFDAISAGTWFGTASIASFVTASNVSGPYGASSVVSSSYAISSSFAVSASWAPTPGLNAAVLINTGSISTTQAITGSLRVTGSVGVAGTLTINGLPATNYITTPSVRSGNIYPLGYTNAWGTNDGTYIQIASFPYLEGDLQSGQTAGGVSTLYGHLKIGNSYYDDTNPYEYIRAQTIWRDAADSGTPFSPTSYPKPVFRTIITDNSTVLEGSNANTTIGNLVTANGRKHVLTVTGSVLARGGVSLGTNIANSHIITGSVNMTGSFTLNGTNLSTLVSPVQSVTVDLSQSDILSLNTSPVTLIPTPGVGKYISVIQTTLYYKYGGTPYVQTSNIRVRTPQGAVFLNTSTTILTGAGNALTIIPYSSGDGMNNQTFFFENQEVQIKAEIANPSGGNGTMRVRVLYTIEDALV